jgi:hypothetical protein
MKLCTVDMPLHMRIFDVVIDQAMGIHQYWASTLSPIVDAVDGGGADVGGNVKGSDPYCDRRNFPRSDTKTLAELDSDANIPKCFSLQMFTLSGLLYFCVMLDYLSKRMFPPRKLLMCSKCRLRVRPEWRSGHRAIVEVLLPLHF